MNLPDAELLRLYAENGSNAAFAELVGRYFNLVYSVAVRRLSGDAHQAKDAAQIVFINLAAKAAALARHPALIGWLYTSTYFAARQIIRGEQRRQKRQMEAYQMNQAALSPATEMDWNQLKPMLESAVDELNERDRAAVLWRFFDGQSLAALGEKLGVSESAARKRVDRALEKMRRGFARRGMVSSTAALAAMMASQAVSAAPPGMAASVATSVLASAAAAPSPAWRKLLGQGKLAAVIPSGFWLVGLVVLSAIGAAAYEMARARETEAALARESAEAGRQFTRLQELKQGFAGSHSAMRKAPSLRAAWDARAEFQKFLMTYPEARAALAEENRNTIQRAYSSFFRSARLTPAQIGQFESAVAGQWAEMTSLEPNGAGIGIDGPPAPSSEAMRAILGDEAYQQFQDYGRSVYAHFWAYAIVGNPAAVPFSAEQVDQLAKILAENNSRSWPRFSIAASALSTVDWSSVLAEAKTLFSASQWQAAEPVLLSLQTIAVAKAQPAPASAETAAQ